MRRPSSSAGARRNADYTTRRNRDHEAYTRPIVTFTTRRPRGRAVSDEADAFVRVVLGLTIAVGAMTAAFGAASGGPIVLVALPTVVLLAARVRGSDALAGWLAATVWIALLPFAHGEALLAPLAMIVLCLAVALGPARLLSWVGYDLIGHREDDVPRPAGGWIEEDGRSVD
jgi:F0F1-type ATP synthase assembly protein I